MTAQLQAIKAKIAAQIVVHEENYETIRRQVIRDHNIDISNVDEENVPRRTADVVNLRSKPNRSSGEAEIHASTALFADQELQELLDTQAEDFPTGVVKEAMEMQNQPVDPVSQSVEKPEVTVTVHENIVDFYVEQFEKLEQLGHVREFNPNWGSARKGYRGLRARKAGEVSIWVSTNLAGQRIAVREESIDGQSTVVSVMYERGQDIEYARNGGDILIIKSPVEIIEFFTKELQRIK